MADTERYHSSLPLAEENTISPAILRVDEQGTILFANDSVFALCDCAMKDISSLQISAIFDCESLQTNDKKFIFEFLNHNNTIYATLPFIKNCQDTVWLYCSITNDGITSTGKTYLIVGMPQPVHTSATIQQQEISIRNILASSPDVLVLLDAQGKIFFVSDSSQGILGYAATQLIDKHITPYLHPDDRSVFAHHLAARGQSEQSAYILDIRWKLPNHEYLWLEAALSYRYVAAQKEVIMCLRDISRWKNDQLTAHQHTTTLEEKIQLRTLELERVNRSLERQTEERKRTESALREQEQLVNLIFACAEVGLAVLDEHGCYISANPAYAKILGYEHPEELFGHIFLSFYPSPNDKNQAWERFEEFLHSGISDVISGERRIAKRNGTMIDVIFSSARFEQENGKKFVVSTVLDISERKQAERHLYGALEELNAIYQALPDLYFRIDPQGTIVDVHDSTPHELYRPMEQFVGQDYSGIVPDDAKELYRKHLSEAHSTQMMTTFEYCYQIQSEKTAFFEARIVPMPSQQALVVVRDITEQKYAEVEMLQSLEREKELNILKSKFIAMVSHEFRTPLTAIASSAELLMRNRHKWTADKENRYLHDISSAVHTMTSMLDDVIYLGKAGANKIQLTLWPTDLSALCHDVVNHVESYIQTMQGIHGNHLHRIKLHIAQPELKPVVDEKCVRQIVSNLLSNGLKYSPATSPVWCSIEFFPEMHNELRGSLIIRISDSGIGISEYDQKLLFEPFHRGANVGNLSGSGLGLAIVKQSVDLHGGTIRCESVEYEGTTFTVTLPCTL